MPKAVADLYYIKLLMRRDDFIEVFELGSEFKKEDLPILEHFNQINEFGEQLIKNGKVVKRYFEGQNDVPQIRENWATFIPARLRDITTLITDFTGSSLWEKVSNHLKYSVHPPGNCWSSRIHWS